jgi:hypothetical protein
MDIYIYRKKINNKMDKKQELSEEDYLKKHLGGIDSGGKKNNNSFVDVASEVFTENIRTDELQYFSYDIETLPCGRFYPSGTLFKIRPAQVREIQSYSMVDDSNFYDVVEKMNDMLMACVRIKYPDGRVGSYLEIKDPDRLFILFLIRELTFQQGNSLSVDAECTCGTKLKVELKRGNFVFHETDLKLEQYFSESSRNYQFSTIKGTDFQINPPSIGIQKAFTDFIIKENNSKVAPNLSFLKIIPFMLGNRTNITYDGIKAKLSEYESMDDVSFQFVNAAVGKMTFGIKELKKTCECGEEVHAEMQFPNGTSGIFVIHDAFEAYIKK